MDLHELEHVLDHADNHPGGPSHAEGVAMVEEVVEAQKQTMENTGDANVL